MVFVADIMITSRCYSKNNISYCKSMKSKLKYASSQFLNANANPRQSGIVRQIRAKNPLRRDESVYPNIKMSVDRPIVQLQ